MMAAIDAARLAADHHYENLETLPDAALDDITSPAARKQAQLSEELHERASEQKAHAEQRFEEAFKHVIWVRATLCSAGGDSDGHSTRVIAQFEDITERKADEALARK